MNQRKELLDALIFQTNALPVGNGYIDIIVNRENIEKFIQGIYKNKYRITNITWWEYCEIGKQRIGMGGPREINGNGMYAEIACDYDIIEKNISSNELMKIIEDKVIYLMDRKYSYKDEESILPGFWIEVPREWKNCLTTASI